jgi:hypothetical protein
VPAWVYTEFPNFIDNLEPGFDGYQYYIEHDPIEYESTSGLANVITAVFRY